MSKPINAVITRPGSQFSEHLQEMIGQPFEKGQRTVETEHCILDVERATLESYNRVTRRQPGWRLVGWLTVKEPGNERQG